MRRELTRVVLVSLGVIVLLPLLFGGASSVSDFLTVVGIVGLCVSAILFFSGIALACFEQSRQWGKAALLSSAVLLLVSFTLCTSNSMI